jgi:hypothetical protein
MHGSGRLGDQLDQVHDLNLVALPQAFTASVYIM